MCSKLSRGYARDLRKAQTREEALLWGELRNRKFDGIKFMRQHPISIQRINSTEEFVIADFYCASYKFVIELDGGYHNMIQDIDANRDEVLLNFLSKLFFSFSVYMNQIKLITGVDFLKHCLKNIGFMMDHDKISNSDLRRWWTV